MHLENFGGDEMGSEVDCEAAEEVVESAAIVEGGEVGGVIGGATVSVGDGG